MDAVNFCNCGGHFTVTSFNGKNYCLYCTNCLWGLESNADDSWGYKNTPVERSYEDLRKHKLGKGYYIEGIGIVA